MKFLSFCLLFSSLTVVAETSSKQPQPKEEGVETLVKSAKKDRKKKVEMCHECGKPEEKCDCKGEEHKKAE